MGHMAPPVTVAKTRNSVLGLPGDIDILNAHAVRDRIVTLLDDGVTALIVDLTGTDFCDCAGIRGIVQAGHHARTIRTPVCVALPADGPVRRVAELTRLSRQVQVATGTAAADRRIDGLAPTTEL
jgi:anti-sigma B factor antagonist